MTAMPVAQFQLMTRDVPAAPRTSERPMKAARLTRIAGCLLALFAFGCGGGSPAPEREPPTPPTPATAASDEGSSSDRPADRPVLAADTPKPPKGAEPLDAGAKFQGRTLAEWVNDLSARDEITRSQAADAVAKYGPNAKSAVPALSKILADPKDFAWFNAVDAVKALGPSAGEAVGTLSQLLRNRDPGVRLTVAYALGELGPAAEKGVPGLIALLDDKAVAEGGAKVRDVAVSALERVGKYDLRAVVEAERKEKLDDLEYSDILRSLGPDDTQCVSVLVDEVKRKGNLAIYELAGLKRIGKKAASATPTLRSLLEDKNISGDLRKSITETLAVIDPEGKAKAGPPAPPKASDAEDIGKALARGGFDEKADWGRHLTPFVRFGSKATSDQHLKGDRFDKIEVEKATAPHREELRTKRFRVSGLKFRPVVRSDIETRGLVAELQLPLRVRGEKPFFETPTAFSGVLAGLSPSDLDARKNYFLHKDGSVRSCTPAEAREIEKNDGILYHPEVGQTALILRFQGKLEVLKTLARDAKSYSIELELSELHFGRPIAWGYFQKGVYQEKDWDCQRVWIEYLTDKENPQPAYFPTAFFDKNPDKVPEITHGRLDSVRVLDGDGKTVGEYRIR